MAFWLLAIPPVPVTNAPAAPSTLEQQAGTYDLTLEECLTWTLANDPGIRQSQWEVERAAGDRTVYRSRALPQLAAQLNAGARGGDLYLPVTSRKNAQGTNVTVYPGFLESQPYSVLTAQFGQPLIDVGIPPALRRGKLEVIIAQQNLNREITDRLHEARVQFLGALYFRDLIGLYNEIATRLQANVDSEQRRIDVGGGGQEALIEAKIQSLNLGRDLAGLSNGYYDAVTRLADLVGRDPAERDAKARYRRLPRPVGSLVYVPANVDWRQESSYALRERADLKFLRALADSAEADKQTVQAGYFPMISLTASTLFIPEDVLLNKKSATAVQDQAALSTQNRAGPQLSWTVVDNGRVTGTALSLEAVRQEYEISLQKLEQDVPRELARIKGSLEDADAQRTALLKSADSAEENLKLIEAQLSLGEATQLDFLNAQRDLLSVRASIFNATYNHEIARADLDRVTGRYLGFSGNDAR